MAQFVVAEDEYWQPGLDLSAALRERGHTVVMLSPFSGHEARRFALRRWARVPNVTINGAITSQGLPSVVGLQQLTRTRAADWQAPESVLNWLSENGYERRLGFERAAHLPTHQVQDKWVLTEFLRERGLNVPDSWMSVEQIPDTVPGPFMFKLRDRGGGQGIERCDDLHQLRAVASLYAPLPHIVQRFYRGAPVVAAGVAKAGVPVQMMIYTSILNPATPFAMAYGLRVVEDAAVADYACDVLRALGVTGPFALDTVPDDAGRPVALDMNLRFWGSWTACQAAGMDVLGSYEFALGLGPDPGDLRMGETLAEAAILRRPPLGVRTVSQRARWLALEVSEIRRRSKWLGPRWAHNVLLESTSWALKGRALPG